MHIHSQSSALNIYIRKISDDSYAIYFKNFFLVVLCPSVWFICAGENKAITLWEWVVSVWFYANSRMVRLQWESDLTLHWPDCREWTKKSCVFWVCFFVDLNHKVQTGLSYSDWQRKKKNTGLDKMKCFKLNIYTISNNLFSTDSMLPVLMWCLCTCLPIVVHCCSSERAHFQTYGHLSHGGLLVSTMPTTDGVMDSNPRALGASSGNSSFLP